MKKPSRPSLLITNDDGILAIGIQHLWRAVHDFADVSIVAPHTEKSGCGLAITGTKPLLIRPAAWESNIPAWSVNGTPADCVKLAVSVLLPKPPDMILSGVNRGANAGRTVFYSGTAGGAMEGALRGIPGIAFSFSDFQAPLLGRVQREISSIVKYFLASPLPTATFINVNFPPLDKGIRGIRMASQGRGYMIEKPDRRIHPFGEPYYWLGGQWTTCEEEGDSDVALLKQGYVTVVPICLDDLTHHELKKKHDVAIRTIE